MKKYIVKVIRENKYSEDQLQKGISVEKEHKDTYYKIRKFYEDRKEWPDEQLVFKWIALDHLKEKNDYYTILLDAGL